MEKIRVYPLGCTAACRFAWERLEAAGVAIVDHPSPEVTHLLLDVPSFGADGRLRGGGDGEGILEMLPEDITVIGGGLDRAILDHYIKWDLLDDEGYLAENAAITADCALGLARPLMQTTFQGCPVLILGWGRIGKCLGQMLNTLGAAVTVAARKPADRGMLKALGYKAASFDELHLESYRLIFNTVPHRVLEDSGCAAIKIDLASVPGLWGEDVIYARGLPGIHAPESSGHLIADTILQYFKEE